MADSKKYNGSTWEHSLRKLTTATDTFTTLPADIYADGNNATVGISGNTVQSGTPTPDSPIMPQGTGDRTGNLSSTERGGVSSSDGSDQAYDVRLAQIRSQYIPCSAETTYYVACTEYPTQNFVAFYDANMSYLSRTSGMPITQARQFTTPANAAYMRAAMSHASDDQIYPYIDGAKIMLNEGSEPLPFEPYGYKIPISSASTTTPVYLGEVETTRKIKKLVLTGEENITSGHLDVSLFSIPIDDYIREPIISLICTHYIAQSNVEEWSRVSNKNTCFYVGSTVEFRQLYIRDSSYSTIADFKSYLAQQYAAGTPVTVWYVLAEPTTGIVNEPIRKIGTYADEVSGITIPTITSKDTFDVDTTLKPSEVSLSYTGWHDASVKEWDGSQWNE